MTVQINGTNTVANPAFTGADTDTGLQCGTNEVKLVTGGTARATVDSSGKLLIGTDTLRSNLYASVDYEPTVQIETSGTLENRTLNLAYNNGQTAAAGPILSFVTSGGTTNGSNTIVRDNDELGVLTFLGTDGTEPITGATIVAYCDGTPGTGDMPGRLEFGTTADGASVQTTRMVINRLGNVNIGSPADNTDTRLYVQGAGTGSASSTIVGRNSAGTILHILRDDGAFNTGIASVSPTNLTTTAAANMHQATDGFVYRSTSSRRFKTNVETLEDSYADAILNVEPVWYRSTAPGDAKHSDWSHYGFIAEDVAAIDPRLVFWKTHEAESTEDGTINEVELDEPIAEGVQYDRFVPHLLNLIKRQQQAIETLETKVAALEAAE